MTEASGRESAAQSALHEYLYVKLQRRRILPRAALVGFVAGAIAVAFRAALAEGEWLRERLLAWAHLFPALGWLFPILASAAGAFASVALVRRRAPEAAGSGIPHLEAVLRQYREMDGPKILPVKFFGGVLALSSGLALGREGPTVQMGAAVADILSKRFSVSSSERLTLLAAGAGAGLSAAFNAPLAGLIFVIEELQGAFRPVVFSAAFVAAAVADIVARFASGPYPVLVVPSYPIPPLSSLPVFLALGAVAGGFGVAFNRVLLWSQDRVKAVPGFRVAPFAAIVGGGIGLLSWFHPGAVGSSHKLFESVLAGNLALALIPAWFFLRFVLTVGSYSTGAPGGIFAPLLILGAMLGLAVGQAAHRFAPGLLPEPGVCAVVGMAAYFTAIVRAPLTGIVLILEMTGDYNQMLPVLVACFGAYVVAEFLNDRPIYEALLERDLATQPAGSRREKSLVVDFEVEPGSPFENVCVAELGLPSGCLLVRIRSGDGERIPTAESTLKEHDWITAVIDADVVDGLAHLKYGCEKRS